MSTYPLGIMFANKQIGPEQHMAGLYYAWLHMIVRPSRRIMTAAQRFERLPQGHEKNSEDSDYVGWLRRQKARYLEGRKAVEVLGPHAVSLVDSAVLYEEMPRFLKPVMPSPRDVLEGQVIKEALTNLAKCYGQIKREPFDKHSKSV